MDKPNYKIITYDLCNKNSEKIYLGNEENKICRFCGKNSNNATFKNISHTIPEQLGNKSMFSHYECDKCNKYFGALEVDLGQYTLLKRVLFIVNGKNGYKKIKTNDYLLSGHINNFGEKKLNFNVDGNHTSNISINTEENSITFNCSRSYTPINVFKSFVKMALSVVDEDIFNRLSLYNDFLMGKINHAPSEFISEISLEGTEDSKKLFLGLLIKDNNSTSYDERTYPLVIFIIRIECVEYQLSLFENCDWQKNNHIIGNVDFNICNTNNRSVKVCQDMSKTSVIKDSDFQKFSFEYYDII